MLCLCVCCCYSAHIIQSQRQGCCCCCHFGRSDLFSLPGIGKYPLHEQCAPVCIPHLASSYCIYNTCTYGLMGGNHLNFMAWLILIKLPTLSPALWPNLRCFVVATLYVQIYRLCIFLCTTWVQRSRHQLNAKVS